MGQTLEPKLIAAWGKKQAVNVADRALVVDDFKLEQNYPNPFNPSTTIRYRLSKASNVSLRVFNTLGQCVATLVETSEEAGSHELRWTADVPSGVYFYRLSVRTGTGGQFVSYGQTRKMIILE